MWRAGESILLCFWIGTLWCVGYIAAPTLFAVLEDRQLAGTLAGELFTVGAYAGGAAGLGWLFLRKLRGGPLSDGPGLLGVATLALLALGEFVVHPLASEARAAGSPAFGRWHGIASLLWLAASVTGLALVVVQGRAMRGLSGLGR